MPDQSPQSNPRILQNRVGPGRNGGGAGGRTDGRPGDGAGQGRERPARLDRTDDRT